MLRLMAFVVSRSNARGDLFAASGCQVQSVQLSARLAVVFRARQPFLLYRQPEPEDDADVLIVAFHTKRGPLVFTAPDHTEFVESFYDISQGLD